MAYRPLSLQESQNYRFFSLHCEEFPAENDRRAADVELKELSEDVEL